MRAFLKAKPNIFSVVTVIATLLVLIPISNLFTNIFTETSETWVHIRTHLLSEYIVNSILLLLLTGVLAVVLGFVNAYIVTFYEFPYRKMISRLLVLPLALPSYIAAYTYADMFSYTGTISVFFRSIGVNHYFDIMSLPGAAFIFAFTLYPYVYLTVKGSLANNSSLYIENAKLLGVKPLQILKDITIPLTRPALIGGTLLVLLETLNDLGVVQYFGVRVMSYAIFDAWFRLRDLPSAIKISGIALLIVFALITLERLSRGRKQYTTNVKSRPIKRIQLQGKKKVAVYLFTGITLLVGFFVPVLEMMSNAVLTYQEVFDVEFLYIVLNTLSISIVVTTIIVFLAVMISNYSRLGQSKFKTVLLRVTSIGYAIPGAVIAVSVLIFFVDLDHALVGIYKLFDPDSRTLLLSSSLTMLGFAYIFRFLTIGFNTVESTYAKIGVRYTEASYSLGHSKWKTLWNIDLPLIKEGLIGALIIVFIDVIKELPLSLILRPTNYDTIATKVYTYASDEMIQEASGPSLVIVLICTILVFVVTRSRKEGKYVR